MTLRLRSFFAFLCVASLGLFYVGCDSGGGGGGGDGNEPPTADFGVSVDEYTADFTNNSSDPDGEIASSEWEFGDGETSSEESPSHTYQSNDTYQVTLTVTDDDGATSSTSMDVSLNLTTFEVVIENVAAPAPILKSGVFAADNEVGTVSDGENPLTPGEAYEFSFTAAPNEIPGSGMQLSMATMFVQSNDIFYAFQPGGISLFNDDGTPISGNVTDSLAMWDAGTEEDQEPGNGSNQPPNSGPDTGPNDDNNLVMVENSDGGGQPTDDGFSYPQVSDGIEVTIENQTASTGGYEFTVRVENVSDETGTTVNGSPLVISPGSYAAHWDNLPNGDDLTYPQFVPGEDATGTGIEDIAEDGIPTQHAGVLAQFKGVTVPISPGGYAAHSDELQLFQEGAPSDAVVSGVEQIAEDGNPTTLVGNLQGNDAITDGGAFSVPEGAEEAGPIAPTPPDVDNNRYTVTVDAAQGDRLSLGTMYVQSNDVFYAFQPEGLPLFTDDGSPISGDQTGKLRLYDAGTEVDEEPGVGLNQAPRQESGNTGPSGEGSIAEITNTDDDPYLDDGGFNYVPILDGDGNPTIIKVTVTPQ